MSRTAPKKGFPSPIWRLGLWLALGICPCCQHNPRGQPPTKEVMSQPDINTVLRSHDKELLAIPGVVGVYVGLLQDEKTPCLKVMVNQMTDELAKKIPKSLEGYPVVLEETGVIRPMKKKRVPGPDNARG